jgi:hypothetical protein
MINLMSLRLMALVALDILASVRLMRKIIIINILIGSEVLPALDTNNSIFWIITPCSPEDGGDTFLRNIR